MRYAPDHKTRTHERIVKSAAKQFRAQGLNGAGVAQVMRASKLTVGGFYKHFRTKDDLVVEAVAESLRDLRERMLGTAKNSPGGEAWKQIVRRYLSVEHCEHPEIGCPIAALAPEIARTKPAVQKRIAELVARHRAELIPYAPGKTMDEKEKNFLVAMSAMAGAVALARTTTERADKERILQTVRESLLAGS